MYKIKDIIREIEAFAPLPLQESYDNSGVQVGDVNQQATGALLSLDITEEVIDEAIELGCNLIIAHHPLIFKPLKRLTGANYIERCVIKACRNDIVIYAAHTNLDNTKDGVNYYLANLLGLRNVRVLSPQKNVLLKFVTFVPESYADVVRNALFNAGAGNIGNYDSCSYNLKGEGTFKANEGCDPYCGTIGEIHIEPEIRIETILPVYKKTAVTRALLSVHPYEEPAFDFYPLANTWNEIGSGIVGELPEAEDEAMFLARIKELFHVGCVKHSALRNKAVREVALCGGSGAFLINDAIAYGADVFITGEAKYNDFYDVENRILLAVIGHYESELHTKDIFYNLISKKMPTFALHFSNVNSNPVKYL
ncbi:Nif3-like dinuclear metal center hexameric protein [Massilibacteroides sp.]|uniref:Nif3-like dinuclear metal center hexameric protein n=1 Tax=Massilibacteroides sp. TaxID=2034766 RepID=UPI002628E910|nr:Nif3-like dinuclear metal center hexameric protein [Massilibacteroides sp.]MDD4515021.1 Nif3-like dinuclear metal center hexameric protein [Massilibacteroides sp.]